MKDLERIMKALANRRRLAILKLLKNRREAAVGEVAQEIRLSLKATSKHLSILYKADLVDRDQRGLSVFYHLSSEQTSVYKSVLNSL